MEDDEVVESLKSKIQLTDQLVDYLRRADVLTDADVVKLSRLKNPRMQANWFVSKMLVSEAKGYHALCKALEITGQTEALKIIALSSDEPSMSSSKLDSVIRQRVSNPPPPPPPKKRK